MFGAFLPLQLAFTVLPCDSYHKNLELVKEMGSKKAVLTGFTGGFTMLLIHLFYALAFWYGTTLVLSDDYSLGKVLTVSRCSLGHATIFFSLKVRAFVYLTFTYVLIKVFYNVMYGSYVLGQMSLNIQYFASARVAAHKIYSIIDQVNSDRACYRLHLYHNTHV